MQKVDDELENLYGEKPNWSDITKQADKNGDGKIDLNEFILMVSDKATLFNEENLRKAFNMLDVDGDGRIDQREM